MSTAQARPASNRGKWSLQGVPHKGWRFSGLEDLGDLVGTCEMCETQSIRYVHNMDHPNYPGVLGVGSVCAGHMEGDFEAAEQREKKAVSLAGRRATWMKGQWRQSRNGNPYINRNGFNVVLYARSGRWAYKITQRESGHSWQGSRFATRDEAKLAAFERYAALQQ